MSAAPGTDAATMLRWIEEVVAFGVRRPGSEAGRAVEAWALERFQALGLQDVRAEPVPVAMSTSSFARLEAWPVGDPTATQTYEGFALPFTAAADGLELDLVPFTDGPSGGAGVSTSKQLRGNAAVERIELLRLPQSYLAEMATSVHDPEGAFATHVQTLPFGPRMTNVLAPVMAKRASAYVGVLADMPWDTSSYYVPYDGVHRDIPALWLGRDDGARLDALMAEGPVRGRFDIGAAGGVGTSANIFGSLPGRGDEWVVIASHHDAPWASAVEDASGIALVLAQAAHWAAVPEAERPHNLLFLLTGGHMVHARGTAAFVLDHAELLERTVLHVHLEHAAAEVAAGPDGGDALVPTGHPEPAWWFTTRDPGLEAGVHDALVAADLRRSFVLDPTTFGPHPPTDGGFLHLAGVPLVSFLTAPVYLFDVADTVDKVHVPSLEPLTRATAQIVAAQAGRTAAGVRAAAAAATATAPSTGTTRIDGVDLAWTRRGKGHPLVLVHGFTGSQIDWTDVVDDLARTCEVITIDHRGHGLSTNTGERGGYGLDRLVADLGALLDDLGLTGTGADGIDLLGHSMGGMVTARWALANPNRLRSLILMDTAGRPFDGARPFLLGGADAVESGGLDALRPLLGADLGDAPRDQELRRRLLEKHHQLDPEAFIGLARAMCDAGDITPAMAAVSVPTTILLGADDAPFVRPSHELHAAIAGSELVVLPGGHSPQEDDPTAWLRALRRHLLRTATVPGLHG